MNNEISVKLNDLSTKKYPKNTLLFDIAKDYKSKMKNPIIGAKINNEIVELSHVVKNDETISFFDVNDLNGYKMYQAGLKLVMITALKELYGQTAKVIFEHSIDKGIMCTVTNGKPITETEMRELKNKMEEIIKEDLPIQKINVEKKEAIKFYQNINEEEKAINIRNISNSLIVLYKLKNEYNYFYISMPYSTGVLNKFDLVYLGENQIVLMFPSPRSNNEVPLFNKNALIIDVFKKDKEWIDKMNIKYVSSFNDNVCNGNIPDFIRMNELVYDNKVNAIADDIIKQKDKIKMVLIAGPSSSGKTTSTKKLQMNLKAVGLKTIMISVDDYFKERSETPRLENGEYDFESLNSIDIELFNKQLKDLVDGKSVMMPKYDFVPGKKIFSEKETKIDSDTILILEGLHCLNEELTKMFAREVKYKIYLSPFTPLSIDRHNHISTVDIRLVRRIVRDNRTRGWDVSETIKNWQNVRRGEEVYIFPHIKEADAILNTALIYELGVLKVYAEPILYSVDITSPYYEEARRLLRFLKNFFPIPSEYVIDSSILREFIGKSIFE